MKKVIKSREDFVNENYYESSSTMVPGAGVGAGLFPGAAATPGFFSTTSPKNITEKNVPQDGANGVKSDPDYVPPAQNTHAVYQGQIQLGDIVEDIDKSCKYYGTRGKAFAIDGSGERAMIDYIVANETENYKIGEVARTPATHLTLLKKHQMNGAMNESINEAKYDSNTDADDIFFLWDAAVDDDRGGIEHSHGSSGSKRYSQFIFDDDVKGFDDFEKKVESLLKKNKWKYDFDGDVLNIYESVNESKSEEQKN
jgi:hypothetical protein